MKCPQVFVSLKDSSKATRKHQRNFNCLIESQGVLKVARCIKLIFYEIKHGNACGDIKRCFRFPASVIRAEQLEHKLIHSLLFLHQTYNFVDVRKFQYK